MPNTCYIEKILPNFKDRYQPNMISKNFLEIFSKVSIISMFFWGNEWNSMVNETISNEWNYKKF